MMYNCNHCPYVTARLFDLRRHERRKTPCNRISAIANTINEVRAVEENMGANKNYCKSCNKQFCNKRTYEHHVTHHVKICKGHSNKCCPRCKKMFTSSHGRFVVDEVELGKKNTLARCLRKNAEEIAFLRIVI